MYIRTVLLGTKNYIVPVADQPACYSLDLDPKKFPTDGMRYNIKDVSTQALACLDNRSSYNKTR